jgi:hypothetical protein
MGEGAMLDWNRLLIRTNRPDTPEMLGCWEWLIGRDKHPLVMTKFGDWFLADPEGRVHWLDLLEAIGPIARFDDQAIAGLRSGLGPAERRGRAGRTRSPAKKQRVDDDSIEGHRAAVRAQLK